jgi:hypothetical protein
MTTVNPTPETPSTSSISSSSSNFVNPVKTSIPDNILFDDDSVPIELMTDLIFENIGGHELINIVKSMQTLNVNNHKLTLTHFGKNIVTCSYCAKYLQGIFYQGSTNHLIN